jgi:hypothetical protein
MPNCPSACLICSRNHPGHILRHLPEAVQDLGIGNGNGGNDDRLIDFTDQMISRRRQFT